MAEFGPLFLDMEKALGVTVKPFFVSNYTGEPPP